MNKNEIFTLWVSDNEDTLPELSYLSLKSMVLTGHEVILYTYYHLKNVPDGVKVLDANEILDKSKIFRYKEGHKTFSGFANLFRLKRIYELGGTWLDLDIILIRNISERLNDNIIICSEPHHNLYLHTNNAFIRFPKHDPCVGAMLEYAEKRGSDIAHGETGPRLILKMLSGSFKDYTKYLKHFNLNNLLMWKFLKDYSKTPEELLNKLDMEEIVGFHIVNTFFDKNSISRNPNGLYNLLEKSILNSNTPEEYFKFLTQYNILNNTPHDEIKSWDLKYLDILKDNGHFKNEADYLFLIDTRFLKKVEIYHLLSSLRFNPLENYRIVLFGKTNLTNDKIKLRDNIYIIASNFEKIHLEIMNYFNCKYIIPINKPVFFQNDFFKDKTITAEIEHIVNEKDSLNIFSKDSFIILSEVYSKEIFDLSENILEELNSCLTIKYNESKSIMFYDDYSDSNKKIIKLIDGLNKNPSDDTFLRIKSELSETNSINIIDHISFHYYSSFNNIMNSNSIIEYSLKEKNNRLNCLTSFYLNKLNQNRYIDH